MTHTRSNSSQRWAKLPKTMILDFGMFAYNSDPHVLTPEIFIETIRNENQESVFANSMSTSTLGSNACVQNSSLEKLPLN